MAGLLSVWRYVPRMDYYPFGGTFQEWTATSPENNYQYNGKELQPETQWVDYGFRMYDPYGGRWFNLDPLAKEYYSLSPYNYVANNPIKNIDPDGRFIGTVVGAIVGGAAGAIDAAVNGKDLTSSIVEGVTAGAIAGAVVDLTVATGGTGLVIVGAAVAGGAIGGATGSIAGQTTDNLINKDQSIAEAVTNIDGSEVLSKTITGAAAGVVGGSLGAGAGKLAQVSASSAKNAFGKAGKSIVSHAQHLTKKGVIETTVNGSKSFSQIPGNAKVVQGVMDNMVKGLGKSGRAAANMNAVTEVVATGMTEATVKTPIVTKPANQVDQFIKNLTSFGNK